MNAALLPAAHTDIVVGDRILVAGRKARAAILVESVTPTDSGARVVCGRRLYVDDLMVCNRDHRRVAVLRSSSTILRLSHPRSTNP